MQKISGFQAKRFTQIRKNSIQLSDIELVQTELLDANRTFPLVIKPNLPEIDLIEWARSNRDFIEEKLLQHAALLFRGFAVNSPKDFEQFADAACPNLFGNYGDLPREDDSNRIYHSTPYPNAKTILFHNESSHLSRWPLKQFFYCVLPSETGGETPIVDCREIYQALPPGLADKMLDKGLLYVRNFIPGYDVRWQDFFKTEDRSEVEAICRRAGMEFEWKEDWLSTRQFRSAATRHPRTGQSIFFNQIQLHHVACLDPEVREALFALFKLEDVPRNVYYGDGSPIEDDVAAKITELYWKHAAAFRWQAQDILMVDNMLIAHARNPYTGPRKIVVAMGEMIAESDLL
jgi:alpha-ketoglutarate-dependent taurine dioxygenase